jgi:hypothetical protein
VSSIGRDLDAVTREHQPVIFQVLADLENALVFQHRLQPRDRIAHRNLPGQKSLR